MFLREVRAGIAMGSGLKGRSSGLTTLGKHILCGACGSSACTPQPDVHAKSFASIRAEAGCTNQVNYSAPAKNARARSPFPRLPLVDIPTPYLSSHQALVKLDYPEKLQNLLLTPRREMSVELVVQVGRGGGAREARGPRGPWGRAAAW